MTARRPLASDREIVEAMGRLSIGQYCVEVQPDHLAHLKPEGGLVVVVNRKSISISPMRKPK